MLIHLHNHTVYSLLDSTNRPNDIIDKIKKLKQPAFAVTEHGNVYSSVVMAKLCKKNNIKFIYGCEFYICDDINIKDKNNKYHHLIILAKNEQGRLNLNELLSKAHLEGKYYKPRIDFNLLQQFKDGLIISSACMAGEISRAFLNDNYKLAKEITIKYKLEFGEDFYLEIQSHKNQEQQSLNQKIVNLAKELNIQWVVTCDSHYLNKEDKELHSIFVKIGQEREVGETYDDCYIQSEDEVREILSITLSKEDVNTAIDNTVNIANKCNVIIPLSAPQIPHVQVPDNFKDENNYLKHLCLKGWQGRQIEEMPKEEIQKRKERLRYEINAIEKMGFAGYYLLVESYANSVKRRGVARGSGGGSFVAFLLNIVDIDPVKYGLYFERFIDTSALELLEKNQITQKELKIPDFDLDFGCNDREKVIQFIVDKYGQDKVAAIGSFMYIWDKTAIKDIGRVLDIPFDVTNAITKIIDDDSLENIIPKGLLDTYIKKYPKLFDYAQKITGIPRSFSKHPCGKIIAIKNLTYYTALTKSDGEIVLQIDDDDTEDIGLVKIDALGLRTVDVIYDTLEIIDKNYDYISPQKINFDDDNIYKEFKNGNTIGIFQFESPGMKETLKLIKPNCLDDLAVANALYRPGSKKYIPNFANRKNGLEKFEYLHPDLESILKTTYGIIVFQEQLIEIGRIANMRNPDELRKATGKKKPELMAKVEPELREGLYKRGWTQEQTDKLWNDMLEFAKYSFNKSHSYAYSIIAYIVAYLKYYHKKETVCSIYNSYEGKNNKFALINEEIKRIDIPIEKFNYKNAKSLCTLNNQKLIIGTSLIKNCNRMIANELYLLKDNIYSTFLDLLIDIDKETSVNSRQLEILISLNYFSEFGQNQKLINFNNLFVELHNKKQLKKEKATILGLDHDVLKQYSRQTDKTYMDFDSYDFLTYLWEQIENESLPPNKQCSIELESLGYIQSTFPKVNSQIQFVIDLNTKYSPRIKTYRFSDGKEFNYKISKDNFEQQPLEIRDVVGIIYQTTRPKSKLIDGKWQKTSETEQWLNQYKIYKERDENA